MSTRDRLGGIIHTYQKFNPVEFPSPTTPPPDMVSPAFEQVQRSCVEVVPARRYASDCIS